jgi:opacity protein-like surface antigen
MKALTFILAAATLAAGSAAHAQQSTTFKPYIGVGVASASNMTTDKRHADAKIFGGVDFSNHLGVEAGYVNFSSRDRNYPEEWTGLPGGTTVSTKGYGAYVAAKYTVPINERFSAYGKLGVARSKRTWANAYNVSDNDVYAGLGAQYKLNDTLSLVGEYENYGKRKDFGARAGVWSAGLKVGF